MKRTACLLWALPLGALLLGAAPDDAPATDPPAAPADAPADPKKADKSAMDSVKSAATGKAAAGVAAATDVNPEKPRRPAAPPETFEEGLTAFYADDYPLAASLMYDFVATNEDTVDNFEWAEFFLGVSLSRMGFKHGAAEYLYNVAKNRSKPEILPDALLEIEALMQSPHDEALLLDKLITDSDFGYLPLAVADFVNYYQGLEDLRAERTAWAERLFGRIRKDSSYKAKALYALAVQRLRRNSSSDAVRLFREALVHPAADRDLRNQARLALARVLYENQRFKEARKIYDSVEVPELSTAEASLYLEKAWTAYFLKDYRRTMGILYALEAPSYREYFGPEKFLLRALVYTNLCHYIPAKREIRRFRFKFGPTLDNIRNRIDLREDEVLRTAAFSRGAVGRLAAFRKLLTNEYDLIDTVGGPWLEVGLDDQLKRIYELKVKQTDIRLEGAARKATREIAEELVEFEEQMYLLDYEVGLAIYRRLRKEDARRPSEADDLTIPWSGKKAYYNFTEEFWNDELPTYDFFVENRCFDEGVQE